VRAHTALSVLCALGSGCAKSPPPPTVALASPIGIVEGGATHLAWHPMPNASEYEVQLADSGTTPLLVQRTRDTSVVLPASLQLRTDGNYRWFVTAYRASDSTAWRSPIAVFTLGPIRTVR
jgi:hypothetical protein